jgi:hypothetical protein
MASRSGDDTVHSHFAFLFCIAHLASPDVTPWIARYVIWRAAITPFGFAVSVPAALLSPYLAWFLWLMAALAQAVLTRRFQTRGHMGISRH